MPLPSKAHSNQSNSWAMIKSMFSIENPSPWHLLFSSPKGIISKYFPLISIFLPINLSSLNVEGSSHTAGSLPIDFLLQIQFLPSTYWKCGGFSPSHSFPTLRCSSLSLIPLEKHPIKINKSIKETLQSLALK